MDDDTPDDYFDTRLLKGDCLELLTGLPDCSIDSIVTDPPYELSFMSRRWDSTGIAYSVKLWTECLRVLKPGGHLLAFGGTRTYHRMVCAIEDAGFEIRDSIHWTYGSGFPKSLDVSKAIDKAAGAERKVVAVGNSDGAERRPRAMSPGGGERQVVGAVTAPATADAQQWQGWGTALKPSHEPIVVARKPLEGTVAANVLEHGTGALNIDGTRVGTETVVTTNGRGFAGSFDGGENTNGGTTHTGRWPANTVLTHSAGCQATAETVSEHIDVPRPDLTVVNPARSGDANGTPTNVRHETDRYTLTTATPVYVCAPGCPVAALDTQQEGAFRFFTTTEWDWEVDNPCFECGAPIAYYKRGRTYCSMSSDHDASGTYIGAPSVLYVAKPSKKERNSGLGGLPSKTQQFGNQKKPVKEGSVNDKFRTEPSANTHPTVKPVQLMRMLCRLVTPPGGTVLDPFLGSGTTAVAAVLEGFDWKGCEMTPEYLPIIKGRVQHAIDQKQGELPLE